MKSLKKIILLGIVTTILFSCASNTKNNEPNKIVYADDTTMVYNRHLVMSVLYQQRAAECKALYYQAFNIAHLMLDNDLDKKDIKGKRAVVVDIDESILDNSPFEAKMITQNAKFPNDWNNWVELAQAKAVPGSVDFLNYAVSKGVEVFYITNRTQKDATIKNLKEQKFPMVDSLHLMLKQDSTASKEKRRKKVMEKYHIVLLMGDNLADFSEVYDKNNPEIRDAKTNELRNEFGKKFIVLPNAMYGDWERAMYDNSKTYTNKAKAEIRKSNLIDY